MDHSALLFMVRTCGLGTHTEASGKHLSISQKLIIPSDMEPNTLPGQCYEHSRINLHYSRSTARVVFPQCGEHTRLRQRVHGQGLATRGFWQRHHIRYVYIWGRSILFHPLSEFKDMILEQDAFIIPQLSSPSHLPLRWNAKFEVGQNLTFSLISYVGYSEAAKAL